MCESSASQEIPASGTRSELTRIPPDEQAAGLGVSPRSARERRRLRAAEGFARGDKSASIAARLQVHPRTVEKWRRMWRGGGAEALHSKGSSIPPRLSQIQLHVLDGELEAGPAAHGLSGHRWTLAKITALIEMRFDVSYTLQGTRKMLLRNGWSCRTSENAPNAGKAWVRTHQPTGRGSVH